MVKEEKLNRYLKRVNEILNHQRKIQELKGERFNIYSILGMERLENKTHSAFIGELLNPEGTHLKGSVFLELFCEALEIDRNSFDPQRNVTLKLEHHIGTVDYKNNTGGRIDIFLKNKKGDTLSIENKIDAGDQPGQINRYFNYKRRGNLIYYLTLNGNSPSDKSKGGLEENEDFFTISYKTEIINWLELCCKEVYDQPILRESIKQYLILVKKITNTMEDESEIKLFKSILDNYQEAEYIARNFDKALKSIKENLRHLVFEKLNDELTGYNVRKGNTADKEYSQIWIENDKLPDNHLFGIESFSGRGWNEGNLFIGILFRGKGKSELADREENSDLNEHWVDVHTFKEYNGKIKMSDPEILSKLLENEQFKVKMVDHIYMEAKKYITGKEGMLFEYKNN